MAKLSDFLAFWLVVLLVIMSTAVLIAKSANAQSINKPTVPEFKLNYTNFVYDQPAATSQWSGEPIPNSSYHYDYREIYLKVRNQPNDAYVNDDSVSNGIGEHLYYNVRVKNHFSNEWVELWGKSPVYASNGSIIIGTWYWGASDSEITTIGSINLNGRTNLIHASKDVEVGDQVDFQVKALIGYQDLDNHSFFGEESTWSETQTLTIDETTVPPISPNPSPTDSLPNFGPTSSPTPNNGELAITIASIATTIAILCVIVLVLYIRHLKKKLKNRS